ncbi:HET-domain-containing protein, partial [Setomelanomma holmii]
PFVHEPLPLDTPSIRLLRIVPFDEEEIIRCELRHVRMDQAPQYTCLSYVWGAGDATARLLINGQPHNVQKNLFDFLYAASYPIKFLDPKFAQAIWVDALCIDQENPEEKNHQVQQMGNIYSRASKVVAW